MKALIQRVSRASVKNSRTGVIRSIGDGLVVLAGFAKNDTAASVCGTALKILNLRLFGDPGTPGSFSVSVEDKKYEILLVSQFTLYADTGRGRRPDFTRAAPGSDAEKLFDLLVNELSGHVGVKTGWFGSDQQVTIVNEGPVTVMVEK